MTYKPSIRTLLALRFYIKKKMIVMKKEPGKDPVKLNIENSLDALHGIIGGHIEHLGLCSDSMLWNESAGRIGVLLDEDGKFKGRAPNFIFGGDMIVGNVVFVGEGEEDFIDLTEAQIGFIKRVFSVRREFPDVPW